ncbi:hypothetical protein LTS18_013199 [Coniosporium uncinatum]|uniref:Uncharacterized protein n=1 Tax=Coniosporium uncinatum TaxID=93489 RepID=A0ACC3D939_9PEZI|nr:hypothetical protein LTS18_013199 [Coniosporium uncinatum]
MCVGALGSTLGGDDYTIQIIKLVTAAIYTNYRTNIVEAAGMGRADDVAGKPTNNKLVLQFYPWTRDDDCPPITPIIPMA